MFFFSRYIINICITRRMGLCRFKNPDEGYNAYNNVFASTATSMRVHILMIKYMRQEVLSFHIQTTEYNMLY